MAQIKIPKLKGSSFRGWTFVLVAGVVLTVLALLDRGGAADLIPGRSTADGSTGCIMQVMTDELNVRSGPSQTADLKGTLHLGDRVDATTVVTDGFRQLEGDQWASNQFLTPAAGTNCD
jgi:hypothetical protein